VVGKAAFSRVEAWVYATFLEDGVCRSVLPSIREAIGDAERVLDIGCGGGVLARRLGAIGVDASIAQARRALGVAAVAERLPFPARSFDAVVSSCAIKHWPDVHAGVAEARRVLRPGGALVIVEMDRDARRDDLLRYAAMTRVPAPLRSLYARFDERSILPMAPSAAELSAWAGAPALPIPGLPYLLVVDHA
jgi:ubiquinone/menaquinone biosynthesis C-methylase UbiE